MVGNEQLTPEDEARAEETLIDAEEDKAEQRTVHWKLVCLTAFAFLIAYSFIVPFIIRWHITNRSRWFITTSIIVISACGWYLGRYCTFKLLSYNHVAFIYDPLTRKTRTKKGGFGWILPWEKVDIVNLNFEHVVSNDPTVKYKTKDGQWVTCKAIWLGQPDERRLPIYKMHDNEKVINRRAKDALQTILFAYFQDTDLKNVSESIQQIRKDEDPFQTFFFQYPWEDFSKKWGVKTKDGYLESVEVSKIVSDAENRLKEAEILRKGMDILSKDNDLPAIAAMTGALRVFDNDEDINVTMGNLGNLANPGKNKGKRKANK